MRTVYLIRRNADQTEGRGPMVPVKYVSEKGLAIEYIEAQPDAWGRQCTWNGNWYGDFTYEEVNLYESREELNLLPAEDIKRQALAKLTPTERQALGL